MMFTKHRENAEEYGFTPHNYYLTMGGQARECNNCGYREMCWDDEEYPIDPCEPNKVRLCDCCTIWHENKDNSGCYFGCESGHSDYLMVKLEEYAYTDIVAGYAGDDGEYSREDFSTMPCDGCGTSLAGARNTYIILDGD